MNFKEELKKTFVIYLILTIITCLIQIFVSNKIEWSEMREWIIINGMFTFPYSFANGILNDRLNLWLPWEKNAKKRVYVGTPITIAMNLAITYVVGTLVTVLIFRGPLDYMFTAAGRELIFTSMVIVTIITLIYYSMGFFSQSRDTRIANERLRKEKMAAELNALKSQVNPHFLFNSFNVLSGLIDEDPKQAQVFLSGLSKIYRYILEHRDEDLVSVHAELNFARHFMQLQGMRFESSIDFEVDVKEDHLDRKLPTLSLQLLLENAVKHNGFSKEHPLKLRIESRDQDLLVTNKKRERNMLSEGSGLGLKNIAQRYELLDKEGFTIAEDTHSFSVNLPLI